ncbi:Pkinase-domain-containing protein [Backusella circina FSU 941]|nr:Pkinase-domain-containing protein [Backusella circina FSU 941]KAI8884938.1 Pkinase-domain-containing protein [Backusella circina FSU 941]
MDDYKSWFLKQFNVGYPSSQKSCPSSTTATSSPRSSSSGDTERYPKPATAHLRDYGQHYKSLGNGSTGLISIVRKAGREGERTQLYAVKKFRKIHRLESDKNYMKRLTSEFCISSTFRHPNVIETIDLVLDEQEHYCTVMEFCSGGDLFTAIMSEHMTEVEISCCFKQLMEGLAYLHACGVAHRDIKPENLLLTPQGVLKIADFGVSDVFQCAWEREPRPSTGLIGSEPYMAPEIFLKSHTYWGSKTDIWSAGIVLYSMWYNGMAWTKACIEKNKEFRNYVRHWSSRSSPDFKAFPPYIAQLIYRMLDPNPKTRMTAEEVLQDPWVKSIHTCFNSVDALHRVHKHSNNTRT